MSVEAVDLSGDSIGRGGSCGGVVEDLWNRVDRLLDRMDSSAAQAHGVAALAARRRRALGQDVPEALALEERSASVANLIAPTILQRVRAACDGPLVLFKGPEVATRYPGRARRFVDLDVLVPDEISAEDAQARLLAAGFRLVPREYPLPPGAHQLLPLELPGSGLPIEIHHTVKFPAGLTPPPSAAIVEAAVPSTVGVDGVLAPAALHHSLLLLAHSWSELPLRELHDLVDIEAAADGADEGELARLADSWGLERAWRATRSRVEWVLEGADRPLSTRFWGKHLGELREPTVLEAHVEKWFSPFSILSPAPALKRAAAQVVSDIRPDPTQTWADMPRVMLRALRDALSPMSEHARQAKTRRRPRRRSSTDHIA